MRRVDKEIKDKGQIQRIIKNCQVCRLGFANDTIPYILPVSFGCDGTTIYFHTAKEGRKIDFIAANRTVCFEFEHGVRLVPHDTNPCDWTFSFQSVIGYGTVRELTDTIEKVAGLKQIMQQYAQQEWSFSEGSLGSIRVWAIAIESMTGKQSKDMAVS